MNEETADWFLFVNPEHYEKLSFSNNFQHQLIRLLFLRFMQKVMPCLKACFGGIIFPRTLGTRQVQVLMCQSNVIFYFDESVKIQCEVAH